jgi:hypothetical protein
MLTQTRELASHATLPVRFVQGQVVQNVQSVETEPSHCQMAAVSVTRVSTTHSSSSVPHAMETVTNALNSQKTAVSTVTPDMYLMQGGVLLAQIQTSSIHRALSLFW